MKLFISIVIIFSFGILFKEGMVNSKLYYAKNLRNEEVIVNSKPKTIVLLTKLISCSACVKFEANFFNKHYLDSNTRFVIISESRNNVLNNRNLHDHYKNLFINIDEVLFEDNEMDSINTFKLTNFKNSDFPVILLLDSFSNSIDTIRFTEFAIIKRNKFLYNTIAIDSVLKFINN